MEKLELKHIVGYLPYQTKFLCTRNRTSVLDTYIGICAGKNIVDVGYVINNNLMPILRPLSDLTKEIDDIVVYESLSKRSKMDFDTRCPQVLKWSYEDVHILLKHHFDIHDLIGKGLAIDINTLTK